MTAKLFLTIGGTVLVIIGALAVTSRKTSSCRLRRKRCP